MSEKSPSKPYEPLGASLRSWREKMHETVAEVSGAVEIDEEMLQDIESGTVRPSEDILELLISHFNIEGEEENKLWKLAGFDQSKPGQNQNDQPPIGPAVMILPINLPVMYSDIAQVTTNDSGFVLSFVQAAGQDQPQTVARIGMSKEQAANVAELIRRALEAANRPQNLLPPSESPDQPAKG